MSKQVRDVSRHVRVSHLLMSSCCGFLRMTTFLNSRMSRGFSATYRILDVLLCNYTRCETEYIRVLSTVDWFLRLRDFRHRVEHWPSWLIDTWYKISIFAGRRQHPFDDARSHTLTQTMTQARVYGFPFGERLLLTRIVLLQPCTSHK